MSIFISHGSSGFSPELGLMARTWDVEGDRYRRVAAAAISFDSAMSTEITKNTHNAIGYIQDLILQTVVKPTLRPSSAEHNVRKLLCTLNEWRAGYCPAIQGIALGLIEIDDPIVFAKIFATGNGKTATTGNNQFANYSYPIEEILYEPGLPYFSFVSNIVTQNNVWVTSSEYAIRVFAGDSTEPSLNHDTSAKSLHSVAAGIPGAYIHLTQQ